jgi:hypothetical protein
MLYPKISKGSFVGADEVLRENALSGLVFYPANPRWNPCFGRGSVAT